MTDAQQGFDAMKARLDEIVDEVSAEGISLDEALALYEEAVKLGLAACDVSEADILVDDAEQEPGEGAAAAADAAGAAEVADAAGRDEATPSEPAAVDADAATRPVPDAEPAADPHPAPGETAPF